MPAKRWVPPEHRNDTTEEQLQDEGRERTPAPILLVVGTWENKIMVQPSWKDDGYYEVVSERTLNVLRSMGANVIDDPGMYLVRSTR